MAILNILEKAIDKLYAWIPRKKPDANIGSQAKIAAHRGAHDFSQGIIENTIAAFDRAVDLGCRGIEFDVQCSADNVAIVHHDLDFKRLFHRDERIDQLKWSQFESKLPQVPTLEKVIDRYGKKQKLFIELKESFNQYEALTSLLTHIQPCKDYYIISIDENRLKPLKGIPLEAQLLIPMHNNVEAFCQLVLKKGYGGVLGHYLLLTDRKIQRLIEANKVYGVGHVESKSSLYREISRGIPWLFTNNVASVMKWLNELRDANPD